MVQIGDRGVIRTEAGQSCAVRRGAGGRVIRFLCGNIKTILEVAPRRCGVNDLTGIHIGLRDREIAR